MAVRAQPERDLLPQVVPILPESEGDTAQLVVHLRVRIQEGQRRLLFSRETAFNLLSVSLRARCRPRIAGCIFRVKRGDVSRRSMFSRPVEQRIARYLPEPTGEVADVSRPVNAG